MDFICFFYPKRFIKKKPKKQKQKTVRSQSIFKQEMIRKGQSRSTYFSWNCLWHFMRNKIAVKDVFFFFSERVAKFLCVDLQVLRNRFRSALQKKKFNRCFLDLWGAFFFSVTTISLLLDSSKMWMCYMCCKVWNLPPPFHHTETSKWMKW